MKPTPKSSIRDIVSTREAVALATLLSVAPSTAAEPAKKEETDSNKKKGQSGEVLDEVQVNAARENAYNPQRVQSPKFTAPLVNTPQTVTVIPKEVIREQNATTLSDVLRNVPGITMAAGEGGVPPGDNLSIRGFSARTDLNVDGIRDFGGYSRDTFNIEQVEVAKGPASTNSGRGSTGGSVNLASKVPHLGSNTSIMLGAGTDDFGRTTFDHNQEITGLNGAAFRINGMFHTQGVPGRDFVDQERWGIAPSIAFGLGTDTRFTLSYFHMTQNNLPDYGIPWVSATKAAALGIDPGAPNVSFSNFYGLRDRDFEDINTDILTGVFEHEFNEDLRLTNITRFGRNDRDSLVTAPRFADNADASTTIRRTDWKTRDQVDEILSNQSILNYDFNTGTVRHQVVGGMEVHFEDSDNRTYGRGADDLNGGGPPTDLYDPDSGMPYDPALVYAGTNSAQTKTFAAFLFDTIKLNRQWEISGGLRYDIFDVDYQSADGTSYSARDEMLSYRAALSYKPTDNGTIYLGYGTSFNPSAEGLTLSDTTAETDPEESRTIELGTKWEFFDNNLLLTAAIFRTDKTNARTPDPTDATAPNVLDGEQRVDGFEFGISGQIMDNWRVIGGYTYLDSEIRKSTNAAEIGNDLANTPDHSFSLWSVHDLPYGFQAGLGVQYIGSRYNNNAGTYQVDDYMLVNALVGYQLNENVSFQLNVYNLEDKEYIDRPGGGHFIPGQGRSAILSANVTF